VHPFAKLQVKEDHVGVHWFGQSSFAVKTPDGTTTLIDPYFPHDRPADTFVHTDVPLEEGDLPTHYVLLTHDHLDHTFPESLARIHAAWPSTRYVGPVESARTLKSTGIPEKQIITVTAGDIVDLSAITVHAVFSKLPEGIPEYGIQPPDITHLGYVVQAQGCGLYFSGDPVRCFPRCEQLTQPVADLKPKIGFLTTHPTEGEFPFFAESVEMARETGIEIAVPSHYACFCRRNYDPCEWAATFPASGPKPYVIPYNTSVVCSAAGIWQAG